MPPKHKQQAKRRPAWLQVGLLGVACVALAAAWRFTPLREFLTAERINEWARFVRARPWAPLVLIIAYTPAAFLLFPRPLLTLIAIVAFGTWLGFACAVAGVLVAAMVTFCLGRYLKEGTVERMAGDHLESIGKILRQHGIVSVFALNQVPVPPFVVQGVIAGAVRMRAWEYAFGNLLGMLPSLLAWTVFGRQITAALEGAGNASYWAVALAVLVLVAIVFFTRRWFSRQLAASA